MEQILNDSVDRVVFFVAVDATDLYTRETGLDTFTVNYVLDNGNRGVMTDPTTSAIDDTNLSGIYSLAIDEAAMTNMDTANDVESLVLHITHASMSPVTMKVQVYRAKITTARTLGIEASGAITSLNGHTVQTGDSYAIIKADGAGDLTAITKLQRADKVIDTATTPWTLNYKQEGTETDLMSKTMKNTAGTNITDKNNVVGQLEQE